jgi:hypothetical protein
MIVRIADNGHFHRSSFLFQRPLYQKTEPYGE